MEVKQIVFPPTGREYTAMFEREKTETEDGRRLPRWYEVTVELFAVVEVDGETKIFPCITGCGPELVPLTAERVKQIEAEKGCRFRCLAEENSFINDIATTAEYLADCIYTDRDGERNYIRVESLLN